MAREPVLDALRRATRAPHERLEAGLNLLDPALTAQRYRAVLERFWGYCVPAERAVAERGTWAALALDGAERTREPQLRRDLLRLGHDAASLARLPTCPVLPRLDSAARGAGYLYVFEGATLGGALIARHLESALGLTPARGSAFFASRGPQIGPMWRAFTAALGAFASAAAVQRDVIDAAGETFSTLERWLAPGTS